MPSADNFEFGLNTKKCQDYVFSSGYKLICGDERYSKPQKSFFCKDDIDKFVNDMTEESEYCSKVIETEFNKPLVLTKKHHENFNLLLDVGFVKSI